MCQGSLQGLVGQCLCMFGFQDWLSWKQHDRKWFWSGISIPFVPAQCKVDTACVVSADSIFLWLEVKLQTQVSSLLPVDTRHGEIILAAWEWVVLSMWTELETILAFCFELGCSPLGFGSGVLWEPQFPCCEEADVQGEECGVHKGVASVWSGCTWDTTGLVIAWDFLTTVIQVVHILTSGTGFIYTLKHISAGVYMRSKCLCCLYTQWRSS